MSGCRGAVVLLIVALGCSEGTTAERTSAPRHEALESIRSIFELAHRIDQVEKVVRAGEGYLVASDRRTNPWRSANSLVRGLPRFADGELRLAIVGKPGFFVSMERLDTGPVAATVVDDALVWPGAGDGFDVVQLATGGAVEDLTVFRSPCPTIRTSFSIETGPEVGEVRVAGDRIEVLGTDGRVRIATAPVLAFDAGGRRHPMRVELRRERGRYLVSTELDARALRFPIVVDPLWLAASPMSGVRKGHTATLLQSGKVLVVGGGVSSDEVFDPATRTWTAAGAGNWQYQATTRLKDGRVLVTETSAQLYDPSTNGWTVAAPPPIANYLHAMVTLDDGTVLSFGGKGAFNGECQRYTPATDSWSMAGTINLHARHLFAWSKLDDGRILAAGGLDPSTGPTASAEIYDPSTDQWTLVSSMGTPAAQVSAVTLPDGRVLVGGTPAQIYDPTLDQWSNAGADAGVPVLLTTGRVLAVQGLDAKLFDPATDAWLTAPSPLEQRAGFTLTALAAGEALLAGGGLSSSEVWALAPNGYSCSTDDECASAHCVDDVCCDAACAGQCEACDAPNNVGTCAAIAGLPHGGRPACSGSGVCAGSCDGSKGDACNYPGAAVSCSSCTSDVETLGQCDGSGSCEEQAPTPCAPYACGAEVCRTSCASNTDCVGGTTCVAGGCVQPGVGGSGGAAGVGGASGAAGSGAGGAAGSGAGGAAGSGVAGAGAMGAGGLAGSAGGGATADDGGCGCRISEPRRRISFAPWIGLLAFAAWRRRNGASRRRET